MKMRGSLVAALALVEPAHSYYMYYGGMSMSYGSGCTSCSPTCQAHNDVEAAKVDSNGMSTGSVCDEWSYTDMGWGSYPPWCSPACNVAACDRQQGNCNLEDALTKCKAADITVKRFKKGVRKNMNADGTVNATISLRFGQIKLETTSPPDPTYMTTPIEYVLQWEDFRWSMNASNIPINSTAISCRDVAPSLLKIPSQMPWSDDPTVGIGTQQSLDELYFLPRMKATNRKNPDADTPLTLRKMAYDDLTTMVTTTSKFMPTFSQAEYETDTPYFAFPFDVHTLYARLEAKPALTLQGCSGEWLKSRDGGGSGTIDSDGKIDLAKLGTLSEAEIGKILPASGDWVFDESESEGPQVIAFHDIDAATGSENKAVCMLRFRLRRNPMVYTLKAFLPDMIVMCIGMAALFINPAIPPLFGGRCSILIIAMLITMNGSLNRNNGLGRLSYLLKIDFVALLNLGMLLLAMMLSVVVHLCFRFEKLRLAVLLDRAVRFSLPSLIFPGVQIFEYMFLASDDSSGPVTFLIIWLIIAFTGVTIYFTSKHLASERELKKMARKLEKLSLDDPKSAEILQQAFVLFDADKSGALDAKEGRKLLRMVNPSLGRRAVADAIRSADASGNGIVEDDFHEMITNWALVDKPASASSPATRLLDGKVVEESTTAAKDYNA